LHFSQFLEQILLLGKLDRGMSTAVVGYDYGAKHCFLKFFAHGAPFGFKK